MAVKPSKYNFMYEYEGALPANHQAVIYNARTGALAVLDWEKHHIFKDFEENGAAINDAEFVEQLYSCGYIINNDADEVSLIKLKLLASRYDGTDLNLTIAPTMGCNFNCTYCFEQGVCHNKQAMSLQTIDKIAEFIAASAERISTLSVSWFGGEPLLALPQIEALSRRMIEICDDFGVTYEASITTNGYLLTAETAERLENCGVSSVQITLDGMKETHDRRRPLADGGGTFDRIVDNISRIKNMFTIYLRINTDKENVAELDGLVLMLKQQGLLSHVQLRLGRVISKDCANCLSAESFSTEHLHFLKRNNLPLKDVFPEPRGNFCGADQYASFVIDADGDVYKCDGDIGVKDRSIMSLHEKSANHKLLHEYMLYDPTADAHCKDCRYLPLCMGGCPALRLQNENSCVHHRYGLDAYLAECVQSLLSNHT